MGNYNRNDRPRNDYSGGRSGGERFGGRRDFNEGGDRPMFQTTCSKCGKTCEVPFKPTGERPVFCRDCFRENGGAEGNRPERSFQRPSNFERRDERPRENQGPQLKDEIAALNNKLDRIISLLTPAAITESSEPAESTQLEKTPAPEKKKRAPKKAA